MAESKRGIMKQLWGIASSLNPGAWASRRVTEGKRNQEDEAQDQANLDKIQQIVDVVGWVDPTGVADLSNAIASLMRAANEPHDRGTHIKNAALSAAAAIPIVGDFGKFAKTYRGAAKSVGGLYRSDSSQGSKRAVAEAGEEDEDADRPTLAEQASGAANKMSSSPRTMMAIGAAIGAGLTAWKAKGGGKWAPNISPQTIYATVRAAAAATAAHPYVAGAVAATAAVAGGGAWAYKKMRRRGDEGSEPTAPSPPTWSSEPGGAGAQFSMRAIHDQMGADGATPARPSVLSSEGGGAWAYRKMRRRGGTQDQGATSPPRWASGGGGEKLSMRAIRDDAGDENVIPTRPSAVRSAGRQAAAFGRSFLRSAWRTSPGGRAWRATLPQRVGWSVAGSMYARAASAGVRWNMQGGPVKVAARAGAFGTVGADMAGGHYAGPANMMRMMSSYISAVTRGTLALTAWTQGLRVSSSALMAFQQQYAHLSGTMAGAQQRYQGAEMRRDIRYAAGVGPSFAGMTDARSKLEDQIMPFRMAITNVQNRMMQGTLQLTRLTIMLGTIVTPLGVLARWINRLLGAGPLGVPMARAVGNIAAGVNRVPPGAGLGAPVNPMGPTGRWRP